MTSRQDNKLQHIFKVPPANLGSFINEEEGARPLETTLSNTTTKQNKLNNELANFIWIYYTLSHFIYSELLL